MRLWTAALLALVMAGCSRSDERVAQLEGRTSDLAAQVRADETRLSKLEAWQVVSVSPDPAQASQAELIVTWPEKGGNDYRRSYATMEACEKARKAVLDENDRRQADSNAAADQNVVPGMHIVAHAQVPRASAVCLPA